LKEIQKSHPTHFGVALLSMALFSEDGEHDNKESFEVVNNALALNSGEPALLLLLFARASHYILTNKQYSPPVLYLLLFPISISFPLSLFH
jgi:hypothetical protein